MINRLIDNRQSTSTLPTSSLLAWEVGDEVIRFSLLLLFFILPFLLSAQSLITIKQDGSGDFTSIQQGVDSAYTGDTILVWPGTYHENVLIEDKGIVLGSLNLTSNDPTYISQTIINGSQTGSLGSCVAIDHAIDTTTLCGFTLTQGSGSDVGYRSGGGLFIYYSEYAIIRNCVIKNNKVTGRAGGMYIHNTNAFMSGVTIKNNHAYMQSGGLRIGESLILFDTINRCNIYNNYSAYGTDISKLSHISLHIVLDTFTVLNPDPYYIHSHFGGTPPDDITWDINAGKIETVTEDLYVSPDGDNQNPGTSADAPLEDIWYALLKLETDTIIPDTIHVASGTYKMTTGEKYPLAIKKGVAIVGVHRDSCLLDAENEIHHFTGMGHIYEEDTNIISSDFFIGNLTLTNGNGIKYGGTIGNLSVYFNNNVTINNLRIHNSKSVSFAFLILNSNSVNVSNCEIVNNTGGRGLRVITQLSGAQFSPVKVSNCKIQHNVPDYSMPAEEGFLGRGMTVEGPDGYPESAHLINCLITDNHGRTLPGVPNIYGSGLGIGNSNVIAVNCTFGNNTTDSPLGGTVGVTGGANLKMFNSILYGNEPAELYLYSVGGEPNELSIYNSLISGGEEGINVYTPGIINYDPSNIDTDPMLDTSSMFPYSLSAGSPCINAGTLDLPPGIELPETDLAGNPRVYNGYVDMGAYEYGPWVGIQKPEDRSQKSEEKLLHAYPNPFRFETNISYINPDEGKCVIRIYDLNGRCVKTLMDGQGQSGKGSMEWNGKNDSGQELSTGTYIVAIIVNGKERDAVKLVKK